MNTIPLRRSIAEFAANKPVQRCPKSQGTACEHRSALTHQKKQLAVAWLCRAAPSDAIGTLSFWFFSSFILLWFVFSAWILGSLALALAAD